ncbi:hypothetical protein FQZ97_1072540 [compost metagenome]
MLRAARAAAGEIEFARTALDQRNQRLDGLGGHLVIDHQDVGHGAHEHHRRQVAVIVVAQLQQMRGNGVGRRYPHDHGVVIGRLRRLVRRQRVGGARLVFHHHGLFQHRTQAVSHGARHGVGAAARRGPHQQAQRFVRPVGGLRLGGGQSSQAQRGGRHGGADLMDLHGLSP